MSDKETRLQDVKEKLANMKKEDNPVLYRVMEEILNQSEHEGEAFAPHRSGTEGGRFSSHWSHSSGIVSDGGGE